jgi:hypothetical protein
MATTGSSDYDKIYAIVRNGYTGDSTIWDKTYEYIRKHPNELLVVVPPRRWSIGHQIVFHGALKLLQKLLPLYNEKNPINIFSLTNDTPNGKTLLDIATERKGYYPEQFEYIERLFAQDKFLQACKAYNWPEIEKMLEKDARLLNEKPPYYTNYFIHYLVLFGDTRKFSEFTLTENKFQLDLQNNDKKTALDLAEELKNQAVIDEIKLLLPNTRKPRPPTPEIDRDREDEIEAKVEPPKPPVNTRAPNPIPNNPPNGKQLSIVLTPEIMKRITCPLTKKVFEDPVMANDGQTYERQAIANYIRDDRHSPLTGEIIDDTFYPNLQIKDFIHTLRQQKSIP